MAIRKLYISHSNFDFSTLNSKWLTKKNLNKVINSPEIDDYHTSVEDCGIKMGNIEQDLLTHCQSIEFRDLSWDIVLNSEHHMTYTQIINLATTKFGATGVEDLNREIINHSSFHRDVRKTNDPVLWVAGCSFSSADGVEANERWGHLVAEELELEEINLAKAGGSIWDATDQILRSDIQKNDLVIWGLTNCGRVEFVSKNKLRSYAVLQAKDFNYYKIDYFFSTTQYLIAMREIQQVINYCKKVGAELYLVNILESSWIPLMLQTYKNFIDLQLPFDNETFRPIMIDYGSDGAHPGPLQHKEYAKQIIKFITVKKEGL